MRNEVQITASEKITLRKLTKDRVRVWVKTNVSESMMRVYMSDSRWRYVMSQRVFRTNN